MYPIVKECKQAARGAPFWRSQTTADGKTGRRKGSCSSSPLPSPRRRLQICCCHGNSGEREGERGPSISQSEFALLPVLHKEQTAEWETCRGLLGLGSYRRCESTLPPAGPTWQTAVQRWASFFPSGANHKQSGRLCARSVSQSHQRPSVLLLGLEPPPFL